MAITNTTMAMIIYSSTTATQEERALAPIKEVIHDLQFHNLEMPKMALISNGKIYAC